MPHVRDGGIDIRVRTPMHSCRRRIGAAGRYAGSRTLVGAVTPAEPREPRACPCFARTRGGPPGRARAPAPASNMVTARATVERPHPAPGSRGRPGHRGAPGTASVPPGRACMPAAYSSPSALEGTVGSASRIGPVDLAEYQVADLVAGLLVRVPHQQLVGAIEVALRPPLSLGRGGGEVVAGIRPRASPMRAQPRMPPRSSRRRRLSPISSHRDASAALPGLPRSIAADLIAGQLAVHDTCVLVAPAHAFEQERPAILVLVRVEAERIHLVDEVAGHVGASVGATIPRLHPTITTASAPRVHAEPRHAG